jgi:exopolysaccharide biosynthesis protein
MASKRRKKRLLKMGFKLIFIFIVTVLTFLIGKQAYNYFFAVHVVIAHVPTISSAASPLPSSNAKKYLDDWNYSDGNISIKISKIQKYTGKDMVTLFVADVKLSNADYLRTAFAKSEYGMHIEQRTSDMAKNNNALFAVNGDFYGFRNNGIIVRNGMLYRDNPSRGMLAFFKDGQMSIIDEKTANVKYLLSSGLLDSFSFGPALIKDGVIAKTSPFVYMDTSFIQNLEPRTGVGFISANHFVFIVVDGRKENYSRGLTLTEFAKEFADMGCTEAYNLNGGGSSTMYFNGRIVNNPLGKDGSYERRVSDIIYIRNPG